MSAPSYPVRELHDWYHRTRRTLPWREDPTPYKVWISEIMLQQTQVQSALPYFDRFVERFPDLKSLAEASESEVLRLWSGLGYYSRARNLHKTARIVRERHGGRFPDRLEDALDLPGVGPYTAGAILSIAYDRPSAILDGNVRRILSRFYLETDQGRLWERAGKIVSRAAESGFRPSHINQALMELGALVCVPKNPKCGECPVRRTCAAFARGVQSEFPPARKALEVVREHHAVLVARRKSGPDCRFLIRLRDDQGRFKNMWEFPTVETNSAALDRPDATVLAGLSRKFSGLLGAPAKAVRPLGQFRHTVTRHDLRVLVVEGTAKAPESGSLRWVRRGELGSYSFSSMLGKALAVVPEIW